MSRIMTAVLCLLAIFFISGCDLLFGVDPGAGGGNGGNNTGIPELVAEEAPGNFFVHRGGDNDADGSKDEPFKTIQKGIEAAFDAGGGNVYVAGGLYENSVDLRPRVSIYGSFNPETWTRDIENFPTTIESSPPVIRGDGVQVLTIEGFTIHASNGPSSIAISLNDSVVITIQYNTIIASDGADGLHAVTEGGGKGINGNNGASAAGCPPTPGGGAGGSSNELPSGGSGGKGGAAGGDDGNSGTTVLIKQNGEVIQTIRGGNGGSGGAVGGSGTDGFPGNTGRDGLPARNGGDSFGAVSDGAYEPAAGDVGGNGFRGSAGGGGGGGGGRVVFGCGGGGGGGGSGGPGGPGGASGLGGGASIGILLTDSSDAEIRNNQIITGQGGNGGRGAEGAPGGAGGKGGNGGSSKTLTGGGGGDGGDGGKGGAGGPGGGGGGGPSIGIVEDRSSLTQLSNNQITLGEPGEGGGAPLGEIEGDDGMQAEYYKWNP